MEAAHAARVSPSPRFIRDHPRIRHTECHAGHNANARAWLSWDKAGYITNTRTPPGDSLRVFVQFENLVDVSQLAVTLQWESDDTTSCARLTSSLPDPEDGWVVEDANAGAFLGDSTYHWRINFPVESTERDKILYTVTTDACPAALPISFSIGSALCLDSASQLDTISIVGGAEIGPTGPEWSAAGAADTAIAGFALVRLRDGVLGFDGQHLTLGDFLSLGVRDSLSGIGFQSGWRVVSR